MKLLALTFVRTSELIETKWSETDIDAAGRHGWYVRAHAHRSGIPTSSRQTSGCSWVIHSSALRGCVSTDAW